MLYTHLFCKIGGVIQYMATLSGWHNLSATKDPLILNGTQFEDIATIINTIKNKQIVTDLESLTTQLYTHITDIESNPHHTSVDQFNQQVIDIIYLKWLEEGYLGSLDQFKDILFRYVRYSTWEEMLEGVDESIAPTVKIFYDYLQKHNLDDGTHIAILDSMFVGIPHIPEPILSFHQFIGVPSYIADKLNTSSNRYERVPFGKDYLPAKLTIIFHGVYTDGVWIKLEDEQPNVYYQIRVDTTTDEVIFSFKDKTTKQTNMHISVKQLLQEISGNNQKITIAMVIDGEKLYGYVQTIGNFMRIPISSRIATTNTSYILLPNTVRPTKNTKMNFPRMSHGDFLEDFSIYGHALKNDVLTFIFNIFN